MGKAFLLAALVALSATPCLADPKGPALPGCPPHPSAEQRQQCDDAVSRQINSGSQTTLLDGGWRLTRTKNPNGGSDAVYIMHAVDTARSDLSLAGLNLRCSKDGLEVLLIVLDPLPRSAKPSVTARAGNSRIQLAATVVQGGEALLLPKEAATLAAGDWLNSENLVVEIETNSARINGVIPMKGLPAALKRLNQNCYKN